MKTLQRVQTEGQRRVIVEGRFAPQGASAPTQLTGQGQFTISRTSAGLFLITFVEKYTRLSSAHATIQAVAAIDLKPQFGTFTAATATTPATLALRLIAVATETDQAANANSTVSFQIIFAEGPSDPG